MSGGNEELRGKILAFIAGEFARKDIRQCTGVELFYAPGNGFRNEEIRKWLRTEDPETFENFANMERLVASILEIAEGEADAKAPGKHRFIVRTLQHSGGCATQSFALSPAYSGGDELALTTSGGGRQDVIANHAAQLMRINAQMYEGTIRVLGAQNADMRAENAELRAENIKLRRENDEARSSNTEREFQIAMAVEKNQRTNLGFQKLLQIGSVVAAKIGGVDEGPGTSPFMVLASEFGRSLRPDQMNVLMTKAIPTFMSVLDVGQKVMFGEMMNIVFSAEPGAGAQAPPAAAAPPPNANGTNGTS
jgi:hypothetical protein